MSDRKAESGSKSVLEIILEFGHKAVLKEEEVKVGDCAYTHDWEVWVRNPSDGKIENYLKKVVFNLHESFKNPVRTITKAPFKISEQGYGGFIIFIDLYFKVREVYDTLLIFLQIFSVFRHLKAATWIRRK